MTNFGFLKDKSEYTLFSAAAMEAERVYESSPAMCAVGCRKALELAVKWVYAADNTIHMPYRDNLQSLVHEETFRYAVDYQTWGKTQYIIKLGNMAVHTEKNIAKGDALMSLKGLFEFIQWIDYCYGEDYQERNFDEALIPKDKVELDTKKIKEQESLLAEKESEIETLRAKIEELSATYTAEKEEHKQERVFTPADITEYATRQKFINLDLQMMGWKLDGEDADVLQEYQVEDMAGKAGQKGFADYVLFGKDGLPLAVVEAKRTSKDPNVGRQQAVLYADALEKKFGRRPMMFTTNAWETYIWDDTEGPQRKVSFIFSKDDLHRLMNRRTEKQDLSRIDIDDKITDRYYQKEAIRAVSEHISNGFRRNLLVMATGTGKTRTASSLTDVLSRGNYVTNVLFLADRTALVKQAKDDFKNYLPDMSLCNLCTNKDEKDARIVFSTYPTILNAIDNTKNENGEIFFTPAHFDLIIVDESHRSIFKKYKDIFEYFDAILVGLTATPKTDVDRNTYDFFEVEQNVPTYAYDYETAVYTDHVLVPYYNYEVEQKLPTDGIVYDELSDAEKMQYEETFAEDEGLPEYIESDQLNKFIFNEQTIDLVLQDLMERGIKIQGGDCLGKSIIFAQNKRHAEFIVTRFNKLYPKFNGKFARRIICDDSYAQTLIEDFKDPDKEPYIAVSVDMLDTGIDVPECVNLVFFKKVRSKIKFWQMIGRGTRLAKDLGCVDQIDGEYIGKRRFLIFDYCRNFEFFRENPNGFEAKESKSLSEAIFEKQIKLIFALQDGAFSESPYQNWRKELVAICQGQVKSLNRDLISVKLKKQYVEKYSDENAFTCLSDGDKSELPTQLGSLVTTDEQDEVAKRFDNFMYGLILANMDTGSSPNHARRTLCKTATNLEKKATIPQVKAKLPLIKQIHTDEFWETADILVLEKIRKELRNLINFIMEGSESHTYYTNFSDSAVTVQEGERLDAAYNFEDYKKKVNRYIAENGSTLAIHKLTHNLPLTAGDYAELERIFTQELGSKEDYQREYGETPFGLLVRKIAKLDHEAAMNAFSEFINDESLNQRQIAFISKIITHIENNGYMDVDELRKPPFDKPLPFVKLFDMGLQAKLVKQINSVKENAVVG